MREFLTREDIRLERKRLARPSTDETIADLLDHGHRHLRHARLSGLPVRDRIVHGIAGLSLLTAAAAHSALLRLDPADMAERLPES